MKRDRILLAHGGGGSLTRELIETLFLSRLQNPLLKPLDDSAVLVMGNAGYAFTSDSYVVTPYLFPGGDIGKLAVCGTVNDLAVMGAQPFWLSLSLILEEGLPLADLNTIIDSGGVYGTIVQSALPGGTSSVPVGSKIDVDVNGTPVYSYIVDSTNAPAVISSSSQNTGFEPFSQMPIYIDYTNGSLSFDTTTPA